MKYQLVLIKEDENGYAYRFGELDNGKLNGLGKYVSAKKINTNSPQTLISFIHYAFGEFKDDELNGLGELSGNDIDTHIGLFINGKPIKTEEYIKDLSCEDASSERFDNYEYVEGKHYFKDPREGYHITIFNKIKVHYIVSGVVVEDSPYTLYHFAHFHDGHEVGLSIDLLLDKDGSINKKEYRLYLQEDNSEDEYLITQAFKNSLWNHHGLVYKNEIRIQEGTTRITNALYKDKYGLTIYLPHSVTYLGPSIVEGDNILVQVYYDGTIEEWNKIQKGKTFTVMVDEGTWYYYHHEPMRSEEYIDWIRGAWKVFIHCKDGDIN